MNEQPERPPASNPNRARDHLANELTYLEWIRTAVSLMGFGILIVKLRFDPLGAARGHGWGLGLVFAVVGIVMWPPLATISGLARH